MDENLKQRAIAWAKSRHYVSISDIQRHLSIGFPRAVKLIEELKEEGILGKEQIERKGYEVLLYDPRALLKVYLLDINPQMIDAFRKAFEDVPEVEIVLDDFAHFMDSHPDVECVVSPANAFGIMNGGYDLAITRYFGNGLQLKVQRYIKERLYGEQPVGTSIIVDIPGSDKKLIHTPTMRIPSPIADPFVIYQCMRTTLAVALDNDVHSIVIPAFGGATGRVPFATIAKNMRIGYDQIFIYLKDEAD